MCAEKPSNEWRGLDSWSKVMCVSSPSLAMGCRQFPLSLSHIIPTWLITCACCRLMMLTQCLVTGWMKRFCACLSKHLQPPTSHQTGYWYTCRITGVAWSFAILPGRLPPLLAPRPTDYRDGPGNDITIIVRILSNMSWQKEIQVSVWICSCKQRRLVRRSMTCWLVFLHTALSPLWWTDGQKEILTCKHGCMIETLRVRQFWIDIIRADPVQNEKATLQGFYPPNRSTSDMTTAKEKMCVDGGLAGLWPCNFYCWRDRASVGVCRCIQVPSEVTLRI